MYAKKIRIGDLLIQDGIISEHQLELALAEQKSSGKRLGQALVDLGFVGEDRLLILLSEQLKIPFIDLRKIELKSAHARLLPEAHARSFKSLVIQPEKDGYQVAMADPMDLLTIDEIRRIVKTPIYPAVTREVDLIHYMDKVYRKTDQISDIASQLEGELDSLNLELSDLKDGAEIDAAPVVRLLKSIFEDAVQMNASDIHIEPDEHVMRIRQRIDGVLHEHVMNETKIAPSLVSRLKIMSGLDISEKRLPQDGRFNIKVRNRSIDIRLSTMPMQYGETVVMRLLDQSNGILSLADMGMPEYILERLRLLVRRPHGMVLVTGPTGSGKTTTLYSVLSELNEPTKKIITAEDPVEYRLERITQVQISTKIDLTFSRVLKTALRQDPDIILIGEMRDQETAEIGLRAAMTGHMVLSTLHTNDSISSTMRLIDMGAEPYLVASALRAVLAQRLVRRICEHCVEEYHLTSDERVWIRSIASDELVLEKTFYHGAGCQHCNDTGYHGRMGVYELLELDEEMMEALRGNSLTAFSNAAKRSPIFRPLSVSCLDYALEGRTTIEEVLRLTENLEDSSSDRTATNESSDEGLGDFETLSLDDDLMELPLDYDIGSL